MKKILAFFRSLPARWKLIWPLAKNDFRSKYANSQLGMFWAFFRPIVMASVYIFVFSFVFSDSVASGVSTLTEYSYLVKKIKFNISVLPAVKVVAAFIIHVFFVLLIILIYLISGLPIKLYMLQLPYYMFATFCFSLAVTRIMATIYPFFKDLSMAVEILLLVGIWACPIMWNLDMVPENYHIFFKMNLIYNLVSGYRESFMGDAWFWSHKYMTLGFWAVTLLLGLFGRKMFRRLSPHFADVI